MRDSPDPVGTKLCDFALDVLSVIRDLKGDEAVAGAVFASGLDLKVLLPDDKQVVMSYMRKQMN